ncbi:MAG: hypothetical protein V1874_08815 [Spirochaetota bacterium]
MKSRICLLFIFFIYIFLFLLPKQILSQSSLEEARREYNQALEEYNNAIKEYNETTATTTSGDIIMSLSKSKFAPFTRTVNRMSRAEAERKVEIAKINLETAKNRLIILESKTNNSTNSYSSTNTSTSNTNNESSSCSRWGWILAGLACLLILLM